MGIFVHFAHLSSCTCLASWCDPYCTLKTFIIQAPTARLARTIPCSTYGEMKDHMQSGDPSRAGMYLVPWTCDTENENAVQDDCKATLRSADLLRTRPLADVTLTRARNGCVALRPFAVPLS